MKRAVLAVVILLVAVMPVSASAAPTPWTASRTDGSGDTRPSGGVTFSSAAMGTVDLRKVQVRYDGPGNGLVSSMLVARDMRLSPRFRQVFTLSYAWGRNGHAVATVSHAVSATGADVQSMSTKGFPAGCGVGRPAIRDAGRRLALAVDIGCLAARTPRTVTVAVSSALRRSGSTGHAGDKTAPLVTSMPAATTDPNGTTTQPDAVADTTPMGVPAADVPVQVRDASDLRTVTWTPLPAQGVLRARFCTVGDYAAVADDDSVESLSARITGTGLAGAVQVGAVRHATDPVTGTLFDPATGTTASAPATDLGPCTAVDVPTSVLTAATGRVAARASVVFSDSPTLLYDRAPDTSLVVPAG